MTKNAIVEVLHRWNRTLGISYREMEDIANDIIEATKPQQDLRPGTKDQVYTITNRLQRRPTLLWQVLTHAAHGPSMAGPWTPKGGGSTPVYERPRSPFMPEHVGEVPARTFISSDGSHLWFAYPTHETQRTGKATSLHEAQRAADNYLRQHSFLLIPGPLDPPPA